MSKTNGHVAEARLNINAAFQDFQDLLTTTEALKAQLDTLGSQRMGIKHNVYDLLAAASLSDAIEIDDRLKAAVLLDPPMESAEALSDRLTELHDLNNRVEAARGQKVLWINTRLADTRISSHDPVTYKAEPYLGIGRMDATASLLVDKDGQLSTSLIAGAEARAGCFLPSDRTTDILDEHHLRYLDLGKGESVNIMRVGRASTVSNFVFLAGETAIQSAFQLAPPETKESVGPFLNQFDDKLF